MQGARRRRRATKHLRRAPALPTHGPAGRRPGSGWRREDVLHWWMSQTTPVMALLLTGAMAGFALIQSWLTFASPLTARRPKPRVAS